VGPEGLKLHELVGPEGFRGAGPHEPVGAEGFRGPGFRTYQDYQEFNIS